MNHAVWSFRPLQNGKDLMVSMIERRALILAWPDLGDLSNCDGDAIKQKLDESFPDYTPTKIGRMRATLETFVQKMQQGDHVLIPYKNQIHIATVAGNYAYIGGDEPQIRNLTFDNTIPAKACAHRFAPTILAPMYLDSESLEGLLHWDSNDAEAVAKLQRRSRRNRVLAQGKSEEIEEAESGAPIIEASYPLRRDLSVTLRIPADIKEQEALRLAEFVRTLHFEE